MEINYDSHGIREEEEGKEHPPNKRDQHERMPLVSDFHWDSHSLYILIMDYLKIRSDHCF